MTRKFLWATIALLAWTFLGVILTLIGGAIVSYSSIESSVTYGAMLGSLIGLAIALMELMVGLAFRSNQVMLWMTIASVIGAIIAFGSIVLVGGYPHGDQGDLSFVVFAPAGVTIGAVAGCILGASIWKFRFR